MKRHEWLVISLGGLTALALIAVGQPKMAAIYGAVTGLVYLGLRATLTRPRSRLFINYLAVLAYYCSVKWLVPALGLPVRDEALLSVDQALFGQTPAALLSGPDGLTDLLSACYLSYHLYLHGALIHAAFQPHRGQILLPSLITAFVCGFVGYLIVPGTGPLVAFPELFSTPLGGGWLTEMTRDLIAQGSGVYDVFPSLHVLMTLVLLDYDWTHHRRRFWWVIGPACGLAVSTLYLRYHYGIDLVAAFALWAVLRLPQVRRTAASPVSKGRSLCA